MSDDTNNEDAPRKDWRTESAERKATILAALAEMGVTVEATFVPFSRSRNKDKKSERRKSGGVPTPEFSLNWNIVVMRNGRTVLTCEYSAGEGLLPSYKQSGSYTVDEWAALAWEAENGFAAGLGSVLGIWKKNPKAPLMPEPADVMYSLLNDADVMNYISFEEWAPNVGYDPDSRAAEKVYQACLASALALHNGLGAENMKKLSELFQDY